MLACRILAMGLIAVLAAAAADVSAQTVIHVKLTATGAGNGATWEDAYTTITEGLAAAQGGDQVWVARGRYVERILLKEGVALYGGFAGDEDALTFDPVDRELLADESVIDGTSENGGPVVASVFEETPACRIDGFTIVGGNFAAGGGIYISGASPTVMNNRIIGNRATDGGGMYLQQSAALIANNIVLGNVATEGAGIFVRGGMPTIANNVIRSNGVDTGSTTEQSGGLTVYDASPLVVNNTIVDNRAPFASGMILVRTSGTYANNIVAYNSHGIGTFAGFPVFRHNCMFGNETYDFSGGVQQIGINGNISIDPMFADRAYGNLRLQPGSPCIGAGSNGFVIGSTAIDSAPRIMPMGGLVDMGAYESDGREWEPGPYAIIHVSQTGDDGNDGSSWSLARRTVQAGIDRAAHLGGEVWVKAGIYTGRNRLYSNVHLYGGFAGVEFQRESRNFADQVTILDANHQGCVVTCHPGWGQSTIDGFTITNGSERGVQASRASPTIANCIIEGNTASHGAGLFFLSSTAEIRDCRIVGNSTPSEGGGLYVFNSDVILRNCEVSNNAAVRGGGCSLVGGQMLIDRCVFRSNMATQAGGAFFHGQTSMTISNTIIAGNESDIGGGMYAHSHGESNVMNSAIIGNSYDGIHMTGQSVRLINTVVAFNAPVGWRRTDGTSTARSVCFHGNSSAHVFGMLNPIGVDGNFAADPRFVMNPGPGLDGFWGTSDDLPGDLHLQGDSPCIDAGNNADVEGALDLDGLPRIFDGDEDGVATVDIGAYEYQPPPLPGDLDDDGDVDLADCLLWVDCLTGPGVPVGEGCGLADLDVDGDVDLGDYGILSSLIEGQN